MFSTIGIIIDIVIVALVVIFALIGLKKGLIQSVLSLFSWGVCIIVAIFTAKYVAGWINGIYNFSALIGGKISESLTGMSEFFAQSINVYESAGKDALIAAIPEGTNQLLAMLIKVVFNNTEVDMTSTDTIGSVIGSSLGHICMVIIAGILVFIVLKIVVALLKKLFHNLEKIKIIGGLNKILGLLLGAIKGFLIIVVINIAFVGLSMIPAVNNTITPIIQDNTKIEKFIYNHTDNLFGKYVIEGDLIGNWVNDLWNSR